MPRPARNPAETRARLIEAAIAVIRTKGWAATSVDDLCKAAGVSKGAFFHHFADKEALALAAAAEFSARAASFFAIPALRDAPTARDRLFAYLALRKALLAGSICEVTCLFGTLVQETWATHPAIRAACATGIFGHADDLVADIAAAKAAHAPNADWTPESLARHTQAVIQGGFVLAKAAGDTAVAVEALTHLERYLRCLLPDNGPEEERP